MKKLIFPFITMLSLFLATSCSTKFNVAAPYKNITIVYGFLDAADTAHYIRIQKAFLDQNKSAITMAQTQDSNFYASLNVRIERYDFSGAYKDSIHLNKVNMRQEGYPKLPGAFFTDTSFAYKFTNILDQNYIYRIKVTNPATGEIDSSDAPILADRDSTYFYTYAIDNPATNRAGLDFSSSSVNKFFLIAGHYTPANNFSFEGSQSPEYIAQAVLRFNWLDSSVIDHSKTPRHYDFNIGYQTIVNDQFSYSVNHQDLYSAVNTGMVPAPLDILRLIDRCDLFVYLSTYDYYLYQQNSLVQGTGLTGNEIEPTFTNIKGKNALGLYTSKAMRTGKLTITYNTIDSIIANPFTSGARIVGTAY